MASTIVKSGYLTKGRPFFIISDCPKGKKLKNKMPYMVVIIDEFGELILTNKKIESRLIQIGQLSRASGIHMILATQSPRKEILNGLLKANLPTKVCLKVSNSTDSRIVLDNSGAEKLIGSGDLLFQSPIDSELVRGQGIFIKEKIIEKLCDRFKIEKTKKHSDSQCCLGIENKENEIKNNVLDLKQHMKKIAEERTKESKKKELFKNPRTEEVLLKAIEKGSISQNWITRTFRLNSATASIIIDEINELGVIGEAEKLNKPKPILITLKQWEELKENNLTKTSI